MKLVIRPNARTKLEAQTAGSLPKGSRIPPNFSGARGHGRSDIRGLIDEVEGTDEIAGVLVQEREHVRQRHVMVQIIRGSILGPGPMI